MSPELMARPDLVALYPPPPDGAGAGGFGHGHVVIRPRWRQGASLRLRPVDETIIAAVAAANPRTVVAVVAAGAVIVEAWRQQVPAILMMWYAGMEGGNALADLLLGAENPSGRMPFAVPGIGGAPAVLRPGRDRDHLRGAVRSAPDGSARRRARLPLRVRAPRTRPSRSTPRAARAHRTGYAGTLSVTVSNTGDRDGWHVVQVYGRRRAGEHAHERWLLGFLPVNVPARATLTTIRPVLARAARPVVRRRACPGPGRSATVSVQVGAHAQIRSPGRRPGSRTADALSAAAPPQPAGGGPNPAAFNACRPAPNSSPSMNAWACCGCRAPFTMAAP